MHWIDQNSKQSSDISTSIMPFSQIRKLNFPKNISLITVESGFECRLSGSNGWALKYRIVLLNTGFYSFTILWTYFCALKYSLNRSITNCSNTCSHLNIILHLINIPLLGIYLFLIFSFTNNLDTWKQRHPDIQDHTQSCCSSLLPIPHSSSNQILAWLLFLKGFSASD